MKKSIVLVLLVLGALALLFVRFRGARSAPSPTGYDPLLEVRSPSGPWTVPLSRLTRELPVSRVTVHEIIFDRSKTYEGFPIQDLATFTHNTGAETVILHCRDGFSMRIPMADARRAGLVLTFHDTDVAEGFPSTREGTAFVQRRDREVAYLAAHEAEYQKLSALHPGAVTPAQRKAMDDYEAALAERDRDSRRIDELNALGNCGPFFPVLTRKDAVRSLSNWKSPDAVRAIEFEHAVTLAGRDYPTGAPENSEVMRGFKAFHTNCLGCHAVNGDGGKSGPELNFPVNVTEYFNEKYLVPMMLNARSIRANSKMAVQADLTRQDAELIVVYLKYMKDHKGTY